MKITWNYKGNQAKHSDQKLKKKKKRYQRIVQRELPTTVEKSLFYDTAANLDHSRVLLSPG